jgi:F0F1-type ATP synthase delta subunit
MFDQILSRVRTTEESQILISEIELLKKSLYESKQLGFDSCLTNQVRHWVSELIRAEVDNQAVDKEAFLNKLKETILSLKILKLTLAFEPTQLAIDKFSSFVKQNMPTGAILEIIYDPSIIAGSQIVFNGEYRDFSLKRLFEEEITKQRADIMSVISKK